MSAAVIQRSAHSLTRPSRGGAAIQGTQTERKFVAIVDDNAPMKQALAGLMKSGGIPARSFGSAEEFLDSGLLRQTACLIVDIRMPGMSGLELHAKLRAQRLKIPTIFITAHGDDKTRERALSAGAAAYLTKPFDDEVLLLRVRAALAR